MLCSPLVISPCPSPMHSSATQDDEANIITLILHHPMACSVFDVTVVAYSGGEGRRDLAPTQVRDIQLFTSCVRSKSVKPPRGDFSRNARGAVDSFSGAKLGAEGCRGARLARRLGPELPHHLFHSPQRHLPIACERECGDGPGRGHASRYHVLAALLHLCAREGQGPPAACSRVIICVGVVVFNLWAVVVVVFFLGRSPGVVRSFLVA